jgi:hypothetical protein
MKSRLFLISAILATSGAFGAPADALSAPPDAHAQAAALGQHPAVLVAQKWSTRGIDPNTFIVAHPARLQLVAASESDKDRVARGDTQGSESAGRSKSARR